MFKSLFVRTLAGAVFAIVVLGSVFWHPIALAIVLLVFTAIGLYEFFRLFVNASIIKESRIGIIVGLLTYSLITAYAFNWIEAVFLLILLPLFFLIFIVELYKNNNQAFTQIAFQILGTIYVAVPFSLYHFVHHYPLDNTQSFDPWILTGVFVLVWSNDTFAYLFGSAFGKRRLFERISPKKSWEGTIGGGFATIGVAILLGNYLPSLDLINWLILSLIIIPAAIFGDLIESMLKRNVLVKDSGNIMPGHGGVLDRFDAANFALPFIVFFLYLLA
ncbi:MAG: phosphatidate cytidylyltransferase [Bacteroidota bacterium]|jgi:phosphatidate cytidylyltransferase